MRILRKANLFRSVLAIGMTCAVFGMSAPTMAAAASQGRAVLFTAAGPAEAQQKAVAIAVGDSHSCLLTADSVVECWGSDLNGQLGDGQSGPAAFSTSPVQVSGLVSPTAIAAGGNFTCALQADGTVRRLGLQWFRMDASPGAAR